MRALILDGLNRVVNVIIVDELGLGMISGENGGNVGEIYNAETKTFSLSQESLDELANDIRKMRNNMLAETDKWVAMAMEKGEPLASEKAAYRQALRDMPEQEGYPLMADWPEMPN